MVFPFPQNKKPGSRRNRVLFSSIAATQSWAIIPCPFSIEKMVMMMNECANCY